jgi:hypothetical protein
MNTKKLKKLKELVSAYYKRDYHRITIIKEKENLRIICIEKSHLNVTGWNPSGLIVKENFTIGPSEIRNIVIESLVEKN